MARAYKQSWDVGLAQQGMDAGAMAVYWESKEGRDWIQEEEERLRDWARGFGVFGGKS
jgi:hypothetical protein